MTSKFYELMIGHSGQSKVRKIYISCSLLYTLATAGFIGLITLAIFLTSFTRMSVKVAEFNKVRAELEGLKGDQQSHLTVLQRCPRSSVLPSTYQAVWTAVTC